MLSSKNAQRKVTNVRQSQVRVKLDCQSFIFSRPGTYWYFLMWSARAGRTKVKGFGCYPYLVGFKNSLASNLAVKQNAFSKSRQLNAL